MTTTVNVLIESKFAETSETVDYTSTNRKTIIDKFTAYNTTASNVTITVHLIPSGGSAATTNAFVKIVTPNAGWAFPEIIGHVLEPGDIISVLASATGVSIRASGRQIV